MRALVTGGAGFIGSNLVDALLARGDEVTVVDDLSLTDALDEAMRDAEVCFHLAAQADVPTSVVAGWNRLHGTRHTALRFANVYGQRQEVGLEGGVVAIFLNAMAAGEETKVYGDGRQTRDFVHVDDVVQAVLRAPGTSGVFNVGSGVETSVLELHERCRAVTGDAREPELAPARPGDLLRSALDVSLASRELGWQPEVSLDDGLRRTWEWV